MAGGLWDSALFVDLRSLSIGKESFKTTERNFSVKGLGGNPNSAKLFFGTMIFR